MIEPFQYEAPPTRIQFGAGVAASLGTQALSLGMQRVMLVCDAALAQSEPCRSAVATLEEAGIGVLLYTDVVLDPNDASVERAAAHYRDSGADGIVALGGGSAMDTAKALGVLISAGAEQIAPFYLGAGDRTPHGIPPLICMPTTAGTGSEVTPIAVVTESGSNRKMVVRHPSIAPAVALVDPLLTLTMPPKLTAATGMDALSHVVESITSKLANPPSTALALDVIPRIVEALPRAVADGGDIEARTAMSYAATAAGLAFVSARLHLGHAVGHSLGTAYHLPHGLACIVCMPAIMAFLAPALPTQIAQIAGAFGVAAADLPEALDDLMRRCGIPRLGAALGSEPVAIPSLIELVSGEERLINLSPRRPTVDDWQTIFSQSW